VVPAALRVVVPVPAGTPIEREVGS
jgi:hypothetical protein